MTAMTVPIIHVAQLPAPPVVVLPVVLLPPLPPPFPPLSTSTNPSAATADFSAWFHLGLTAVGSGIWRPLWRQRAADIRELFDQPTVESVDSSSPVEEPQIRQNLQLVFDTNDVID